MNPRGWIAMAQENKEKATKNGQLVPFVGEVLKQAADGQTIASIAATTGASRALVEKVLGSARFVLHANDGSVDEFLDLVTSLEGASESTRSSSRHTALPGGRRESQGLACKARQMLNDRRRQYEPLPFELQREAVVLMMLELFSHESERRTMSCKSLCISSGCPHTTALRHIDRLVRQGLVRRRECEHDRRVTLIELTSVGYETALEIVLNTGR